MGSSRLCSQSTNAYNGDVGSNKGGRRCVWGAWVLVYADDLALTAEIAEEARDMFSRRKALIEQQGMKMHVEKMKLIVSGETASGIVELGR